MLDGDGAVPSGLYAETPVRVERQERPRLAVVDTPVGRPGPARQRADERIQLRVTFSELVLIHKALQAVRMLGSLPPQDELLSDTLQVVDVTLNGVVQGGSAELA